MHARVSLQLGSRMLAFLKQTFFTVISNNCPPEGRFLWICPGVDAKYCSKTIKSTAQKFAICAVQFHMTSMHRVLKQE